jgi:hypothetical protein
VATVRPMDLSERRRAATRLYRLAGLAMIVVGLAAGTLLVPAAGLLLLVTAGPLAGQAESKSSR